MEAIKKAYIKYGYPSANKLYELLDKKIPLSQIQKALEDEVVREL